MKILMVNLMPLTGSGSGVYAANLANALCHIGHEVCCIFPDNTPVNPSDYEFKIHPIYFVDDKQKSPDVTLDVMPFNFPCFTTHPRSTNNFRELSDSQLQIYVDAFRSAIAEEVAEFKPDVIHSGHIWISSAISGEFNIPLVITCHGTDIIGFSESDRFHKFANAAAEKASAIICISEQNLSLMKKHFPGQAHKALLMPNGYDSNVFYREPHSISEVLAEYGIEKPYKKLVSFAGKFTYFKGIDVLLNATAMYSDGETATLLAGDGELFNEMNELAHKLGLQDVYFLHNQPHDRLRRLYNAANVSLVPSRGEAFGLVVIEANACGAPVIGTNDGGITGILTPETGVLINPEDPKAVATNVKAILNGEKTFDRQHIANYTKATFSQEKLIAETAALYQSII